MEGQFLEEVGNAAGISHLIPGTGIDHHADGAELSESLLRRDTQSIG